MKVVFITDTHFGCRNDSPVFANYIYNFYETVFFPYLKENNIDTVVHLGDIVDRRKFINFSTLHQFRNKFVIPLREMGIKIHVIVGNHDVYWRSTNNVNAMQELFKDNDENITVYSNAEVILLDKLKVLLVPWINRENYQKTLDKITETSATVCLGHLELQGFEASPGHVMDHGMSAEIFKKFDFVASGHYHHKSTQGNINYLGAPYEITWRDYQDPRGFHCFDTDTLQLDFVQNPYSMFHKIYYDDTDKTMDEVLDIDYEIYRDYVCKVIVLNKNKPYWFDVFLDRLYKASPFNVQIVEGELFRQYDADASEQQIIEGAQDTLTILEDYVGTVNQNEGVQKQLIKVLTSLYDEAQNVEQQL